MKTAGQDVAAQLSYTFYTPQCPNAWVEQQQSESLAVPKIQDWELPLQSSLHSLLSASSQGTPGGCQAGVAWELWAPCASKIFQWQKVCSFGAPWLLSWSLPISLMWSEKAEAVSLLVSITLIQGWGSSRRNDWAGVQEENSHHQTQPASGNTRSLRSETVKDASRLDQETHAGSLSRRRSLSNREDTVLHTCCETLSHVTTPETSISH